MKQMLIIVLALLSGVSTWAQQAYLGVGTFAEKENHKILVCGSEEVQIIDPALSDTSHAEVTWKWTGASTSAQLGSSWRDIMARMDDCKPIKNNTRILCTASTGGGVMIVNIFNKTVEFYAKAPQAHSAELLPNNRIVVALSTAEKGNALEVFDISKRTGDYIIRDSMYSAHAVVYYEETQRLYALGANLLRIYRLTDWETSTPSLTLEKEFALPIGGAHDMTRINANQLLISCTGGVYYYDIAKNAIFKFAPLEGYTNLKSVNYNEKTGQIIYTTPEESYWTFHVHSINPDWTIPVPDINMYKVRVFGE